MSPQPIQPVRAVHPIEARSYQILRSRVDTSALPPLTRAVVERVIHASADLDYLGDLRDLLRGRPGEGARGARVRLPGRR